MKNVGVCESGGRTPLILNLGTSSANLLPVSSSPSPSEWKVCSTFWERERECLLLLVPNQDPWSVHPLACSLYSLSYLVCLCFKGRAQELKIRSLAFWRWIFFLNFSPTYIYIYIYFFNFSTPVYIFFNFSTPCI